MNRDPNAKAINESSVQPKAFGAQLSQPQPYPTRNVIASRDSTQVSTVWTDLPTTIFASTGPESSTHRDAPCRKSAMNSQAVTWKTAAKALHTQTRYTQPSHAPRMCNGPVWPIGEAVLGGPQHEGRVVVADCFIAKSSSLLTRCVTLWCAALMERPSSILYIYTLLDEHVPFCASPRSLSTCSFEVVFPFSFFSLDLSLYLASRFLDQ